MNDQEMLKKCITDSKKAKELFIIKYSDHVYKIIQYTFYVKKINYTQFDIEDLHNTVFLKIFEKRCKKLKQFKGKNGCSLFSWIRLIAINTVIDFLRKTRTDPLSKTESNIDLESMGEQLKGKISDPLTLITKNEQHSFVVEAVETLAPRHQLLIKLHFFKGLSVKEIADLMNISSPSVHSLKHRALKNLRSTILKKNKFKETLKN